MINTPRTDEEAGYYDQSGCWKYSTNGECVTSDFARELERELNAANERIKRLEEAGDKLAYLTISNGNSHRNWRNAKEANP